MNPNSKPNTTKNVLLGLSIILFVISLMLFLAAYFMFMRFPTTNMKKFIMTKCDQDLTEECFVVQTTQGEVAGKTLSADVLYKRDLEADIIRIENGETEIYSADNVVTNEINSNTFFNYPGDVLDDYTILNGKCVDLKLSTLIKYKNDNNPRNEYFAEATSKGELLDFVSLKSCETDNPTWDYVYHGTRYY